ncbi:hypothetical protein JRQ81_012025 [Phrynocephalus forsythii]|uniref:Uncharacterized protein n=1 Tax=Phrynocephalus forsythii TaxID=171643 RepID=A0A9Q0X8V8_9SAUR|nr:hypothetical protein JRQ81_012025 [Phrynocephalus forsythii]
MPLQPWWQLGAQFYDPDGRIFHSTVTKKWSFWNLLLIPFLWGRGGQRRSGECSIPFWEKPENNYRKYLACFIYMTASSGASCLVCERFRGVQASMGRRLELGCLTSPGGLDGATKKWSSRVGQPEWAGGQEQVPLGAEAWWREGIELEGELERAHRLQSKRTGGEPHPVIVKFAREKTQQQVFLALKKMKELNFKGKKIFVRRDFCPETLKQKSLMKPYAQKLHQNKIKFSWIYPTSIAIFKEGKRLLARNPQEAAKLLVKLKLDTRDLEDQTSMDEEEGEEGPSTRKEKRQRMHSDEGL